MNRILRHAPWWLATCTAAFGAIASLTSDNRFDVLWRVFVVLAASTAGIVAHRSNRVPRVVVAGVILVSLRVALLDVGASALVVADLTWTQAFSDAIAGIGLIVVVMFSLHSRRGGLAGRELLDGITVGTGAALAAWITLGNPVLVENGDLGLAIMTSTYLPFAVVLLVLTIDLWIDGLVRNRAMWFIMGAVTANLAGIIVWVLAHKGTLDDAAVPVAVGCFVSSLFLFCAAIAHRSAPKILEPLDESQLSPHRETLRIAPIVASVAVPVILMSTIAPSSPNDQLIRIVGAVVIIGSVMARLFVALNVGARSQITLLRRLHQDDLTGLSNRVGFVELLSDVLEDTWRTEFHPTVLQVNIDRFKNLHDTLGHNEANRVLVMIANQLSTAVSTFGGTVARSGNDDFLVVDGSTKTTDDSMVLIEAIREALGAPMSTGESPIFITASFGLAIAPRNRTLTAEQLIRRADIASQQAKADGRNRVAIFDDSMQDRLTRRMDVEHALHGAIGRREMRLYHQPIVDIETGKLSGFEALIRWQRPDGTLVPPLDFIPVAEDTGIICELGAWALEEALTQLRGWIDDGVVPPTTTTSVNVSPRQIADPKFAQIVRDVLDKTGVSPHLLWIEMTESMMLEEPDLAQGTLRQIRDMGVRIALDDFGTGYSSLSLLQQFPIQRIKIDRAFVRGIADTSNDRSLVRTIIAMARSMGLDLVAEGVETVHQLQSLRELECDKAQGFLISHPVPPAAMRTTMLALDELASLSLFGDPSLELLDRVEAVEEFAPSGPTSPLVGSTSRPIGQPLL